MGWLSISLSAQESPKEKGIDTLSFLSTVLLEEDTLPEVRMKAVVVHDRKEEKGKAYQRKYERLKPKVIKVYPYAEVAGLLLEHYEKRLSGMKLEARQKLFMKKVEEDLKAEFKDEITELTVSEGRVLMKLIDRETGNTSYQIIEELRGDLAAFFWQGVARVFGHDLKADYDPVDDERVIEDIVLDIRSGELEVPERKPKSDKVKELLKAEEDIGRWWTLKG
jgi:hypothetical protein